MTPAPSPSSRWRATSIVAVSVLAALALAIVACLVLIQTRYFHQQVVRYVAAHLNREIDVRGNLTLDLLSSTPTLTATDVRLGNPHWMPPGTCAEIGQLEVVFRFPWPGREKSILRLEMLSAQLHLVRKADGRANWQWNPPGVRKKKQGPLVRSLSMPNARVVLDDARRHLQFEGIVTAGDVRPSRAPSRSRGRLERVAAAPASVRIAGSGKLNGRAATFEIEGEPLARASHDRPYRFTFVERSGKSQLRGHGRLLQPFNPGMLDAEFFANGASMRELYYLAGMHFPESAPFTLTGKVERRDRQSRFSDLKVRFGESDVRGTVALAIEDGQPRFDAELSSHLLRLRDFGRHEPDGSHVPAASSPSTSSARGAAAASLLLPDSPVPLKGLRNRSGVVRYRADKVDSRALSISAFSTQASVHGGVLDARRIAGRLRESHIAGAVKIDVRGHQPETTLDLTLTDLPLAQFARKGNAQPPFEGLLQARIDLSGRGNSVHEIASSASGRLALSMSGGAMRASMAEMTAATLRGLGLTLTKSDEETPVHCGVAAFRAERGVLKAERIVIDTEPIVIHGAGTVRLDTEALDLTLRGEPRKPRLLRLRTPITLGGSLKHPSVKMASADAPKVPEGRAASAGGSKGPEDNATSAGASKARDGRAASADASKVPKGGAVCEPATLAAKAPDDAPLQR